MTAWKKWILAGVVIFAAVVVFFIIFGQTLRELSTPKVSSVQPAPDEVRIEYTAAARFEWANLKDVVLTEAQQTPVMITEVSVKSGQVVEPGTVLFRGQVQPAGDELIRSKQSSLTDLKMQMNQMEYQKQRLKINLEDEKVLLYQQYEDALTQALTLHEKAQLAGETEKAALTKQADDADIHASELGLELSKKLEKGSNQNYSFALQYFKLADQVKTQEQELVDMMAGSARLEEYVAQSRFVCTDVYLQAGMEYTGNTPAFTMTETLTPVLKATLAGSPPEETLSAGEIVRNNKTYSWKIAENVKKADGLEYTFQPNEDFMGQTDSPGDLVGKEYSMQLTTAATRYDCVLPAGAVIEGSAKERSSIYIIKERNGLWSQELYVQKLEVTELARSNDKVAIEGTLTDLDKGIAVYWDRPLSDGQQVYLYSK